MVPPDAGAIVINHLHKRFGDKHAVNDLSMVVPHGSFFGLVGPNGAGKTTALSMVTGLLRPDHGTVAVLGHDVWVDPVAAKARVGVLPDGVKLFDRLSGRELLRYTGLLRLVAPADLESRSTALLAALGLADDADKLVVDYSAGMTKKVSLACALIHAPRLLILDEPLEAVDPVSGQAIRGILHDYVAGGGTVVISSHVMELVEGMCSHVAVIADGRVRAWGTLDDVRRGMSLQDRFLDLVGAHVNSGAEGLSWLNTSSASS